MAPWSAARPSYLLTTPAPRSPSQQQWPAPRSTALLSDMVEEEADSWGPHVNEGGGGEEAVRVFWSIQEYKAFSHLHVGPNTVDT